MILCRICGAEITDAQDHPDATCCYKCRYRGDARAKTYGKYGPEVVRWFDSHGWPEHINARAYCKEHKALFAKHKLKETGRYKILGLCLGYVEHDGKSYRKVSKKTYQLVTE